MRLNWKVSHRERCLPKDAWMKREERKRNKDNLIEEAIVEFCVWLCVCRRANEVYMNEWNQERWRRTKWKGNQRCVYIAIGNTAFFTFPRTRLDFGKLRSWPSLHQYYHICLFLGVDSVTFLLDTSVWRWTCILDVSGCPEFEVFKVKLYFVLYSFIFAQSFVNLPCVFSFFVLSFLLENLELDNKVKILYDIKTVACPLCP